MIISHSKKFIFIHNYKVGGTSIRLSLRKYDNRSFRSISILDQLKLMTGVFPWVFTSDFSRHINISNLKRNLSNKIFENYYKFGFVRDPWDYQVSLYTYSISNKNHKQHELIKSFQSFDEYIDWKVHQKLQLQKDFFYENDKCLMDFIGRFENINEDFKLICERIGVNCDLPHLNSSRRVQSYLSYYSNKSIEMVNQAFYTDIELFNYKKPNLIYS